MATDKRIKICPSESCEMNIKRVKYKANAAYCSACGTKLIFVCRNCFQEIEDVDPKHDICKLCEAEADEKRIKRLDSAKSIAGNGAKIAVGIATPVVAGIAKKGLKNVQKVAINDGYKIVKNMVEAVIKK